ncbi:MAG: alpha/beta fold hydrolase [Candidatus Eremiobacteraeota bacterium]|nr:alpha/beta fold hydrolase [Candidatus Eremiobacteraeota bacterium]
MIFALMAAAALGSTAAPSPATSAVPSSIPPAVVNTLPEGTYTFQGVAAGQVVLRSTVVVRHSDAGIVVDENESVLGAQGTTLTHAAMRLTADLHPIHYDATYGAGGDMPIPVKVDFTPTGASVTAKGQTLAITLAANTSRFVILDGALLSGFLLLPQEMRGQSAVTGLAPVLAFTTPLTAGSDNPPRPKDLSDRESHLSILGPVPFVEWFDPATGIVDEIDVPSQTLVIKLQFRSAATNGASTPAPLPNSSPLPLGAQHYRNSEISFRSADGTRLAGTLSLPATPRRGRPGVLMLVGSGNVDRDERIGPNLIFAQLGHALSNAGYTVLRYDKRGIGKSGGDPYAGVRRALIADATAAVEFFRQQPGVSGNEIFALGHSEGAMLATALGANSLLRLRGVVLLGPPALPLDQVVTKQARNAPAALIGAIRASSWYKSYLRHDPAQEIKAVRTPLLVLQGAQDENVLAADTPRLVNAARLRNNDVTAVYLKGDSHEFLAKDLMTPQHLDPAMIKALLAWLARHS